MRPQRTLGQIPSSMARMNEINARVLGGQVSFGHTISNADQDINLDIWKASGTAPGTANTDFTVPHNLGHIPITIVGQDTTNGGVLYRSPTTPWTKNTVTLRCTMASSAYNLVLG